MIILVKTSDLTGIKNRMHIPMGATAFKLAYSYWKEGMLIDLAFPKLNDDQREFVKTGITPDEWDALLPSTSDLDMQAN